MKDEQGYGLTEGWGGFLGILNVLAHVGRETWCSRGRLGPRLWKFSDGKPLVQGQLEDWHGQALAFTHFTPGICVHHWGIVRGTGPEVEVGPVFLGTPHRRRHRQRLSIVRIKEPPLIKCC